MFSVDLQKIAELHYFRIPDTSGMLSRLIIIPLKANQQKHIFTFLHYTFVKIC